MTTEPASTLGQRIAAARTTRGLSQRELAVLANVSDAAVSRWECDQRELSVTRLLELADVLKVPVVALIQAPDPVGALYRAAYLDGWRDCAQAAHAATPLSPPSGKHTPDAHQDH